MLGGFLLLGGVATWFFIFHDAGGPLPPAKGEDIVAATLLLVAGALYFGSAIAPRRHQRKALVIATVTASVHFLLLILGLVVATPEFLALARSDVAGASITAGLALCHFGIVGLLLYLLLHTLRRKS